jgi:hypothetical protein
MTNTTRRIWKPGLRFQLGRLVATPGALGLGVDLLPLIKRHARGDWGNLCEEDHLANERALVEGTRILSAYVLPEGKVWIITEADRSATTLLLPDEY